MKAYERLIKYTKFHTGSDENNENCPSTEVQRDFASYLVNELHEMGIKSATVDENGYVYAKIPANNGKNDGVKIGFIAHMDTVSDVEYRNVNTRVVENYDGNDIVLNSEKGIIMKVDEFPSLENYVGNDLVVTDGTTILGADDKAGIAEIMTAAERIMNDSNIIHGDIMIGFTPDEEIGRGADLFDIKKFGADFAYTLDGGAFGQLEYENFNATNARVVINGKSVHPGSAKYGNMKNASKIAMEFDSMLPKAQRPEYTEMYEGFFHLTDMKGDVEKCELRYILRDHDATKLKIKKATMEKIAEFLNTMYGKETVELTLVDSYSNMAEYIEPHYHLIENGKKAIEMAGGITDITPIRGGTDGARLSEMGLPCPNLGTGSENHHGRFEFACVQDMEKCVDTVLNIVGLYK